MEKFKDRRMFANEIKELIQSI